MFATEFDILLDEDHKSIKLVPEDLAPAIDELNQWVYVRRTSILQTALILISVSRRTI